jgi:hypothetical protein
MTLQNNLDSLKNKKLSSKTTLGDLQGLVPDPYAKLHNMDNPRQSLAKFYFQTDDYQSCGFYNCGFFGNRLERIKHVKNQHSNNHDCKLSPDSSCAGCEIINEVLNK